MNPIQCFNNVDTDTKPCDYTYVTKPCMTSDDIKIDLKISSLQSCTCQDRCTDDSCACGKMSIQCWYDDEGRLVPDFNFNGIYEKPFILIIKRCFFF